jgi:hypothetical protein
MPIRDLRPSRRLRRLFAVLTTCMATVAGASATVPSTADAYTEHFCQYAVLYPGWECFASNRHTLQMVTAYSINSWSRVCAASFSGPWGAQNSDWRCDYGVAQKYLGGRVDGVGAIHNGDPLGIYGYGTQDF